MTSTSTVQEEWLLSAVIRDLDAALAYWGDVNESQIEHDGQNGALSQSTQGLRTGRFTDNQSSLHITGSADGQRLTLLEPLDLDGRAWMCDANARIRVKLSGKVVRLGLRLPSPEQLPGFAPPGTVLVLDDYLLVLTPHGAIDDRAHLLIRGCSLALQTEAAEARLERIDPELTDLCNVENVAKRIKDLFDLRRHRHDTRVKQERLSHPMKSNPLVIELDSTPEPETQHSPTINTQLPLATQMPLSRLSTQESDVAVVGGVNLNRPKESRKSMHPPSMTTSDPRKHLLDLLRSTTNTFSHAPKLPDNAFSSGGQSRNLINGDEHHKPATPQVNASWEGTNAANDAAAAHVPNPCSRSQASSRSRSPSNTPLTQTTRTKWKVPPGIQLSPASELNNPSAKQGNEPELNNLESPIQDILSTIQSTSMNELDPDRMVIEHHSTGKAQPAVGVQNETASIPHQDLTLDAPDQLLTSHSRPAERKPLHLHQGNFRFVRLLSASNGVPEDQAKLLNRDESWQHPRSSITFPKGNIPISLLKQFNAEADKAALRSTDDKSIHKEEQNDSGEEAEVSGPHDASNDSEELPWSPSPSQHIKHKVIDQSTDQSSPARPPTSLIPPFRTNTVLNGLPPDSSAQLMSESSSPYSPPEDIGHHSLSSQDPRDTLARLSSHSVDRRSSATRMASSQQQLYLAEHESRKGLASEEANSYPSDLELEEPQALPARAVLPGSSGSTHGKTPLGSTNRSQASAQLSPIVKTPSQSLDLSQRCPEKLVPGTFGSDMMRQYNQAAMVHTMDGAMDTSPAEKQAPSSIGSVPSTTRNHAQHEILSPMLENTLKRRKETASPMAQAPPTKRQKQEIDFDWDSLSQRIDPIEENRRRKLSFKAQLQARVNVQPDPSPKSSVEDQTKAVSTSSQPQPTSGSHTNIPASVSSKRSELQTNVDKSYAHTVLSNETIPSVASTSNRAKESDVVNDPEAVPHLSVDKQSKLFAQSGTPKTTKSKTREEIYALFRSTYPDYKGDVNHFLTLCHKVKELTEGSAILPRYVWDDFIVRQKTEYAGYALSCIEAGEAAKPYERYYQDEVARPMYTSNVVNPMTLKQVIASNEPAAAVSEQEHVQLPEPQTALTTQPPKSLPVDVPKSSLDGPHTPAKMPARPFRAGFQPIVNREDWHEGSSALYGRVSNPPLPISKVSRTTNGAADILPSATSAQVVRPLSQSLSLSQGALSAASRRHEPSVKAPIDSRSSVAHAGNKIPNKAKRSIVEQPSSATPTTKQNVRYEHARAIYGIPGLSEKPPRQTDSRRPSSSPHRASSPPYRPSSPPFIPDPTVASSSTATMPRNSSVSQPLRTSLPTSARSGASVARVVRPVRSVKAATAVVAKKRDATHDPAAPPPDAPTGPTSSVPQRQVSRTIPWQRTAPTSQSKPHPPNAHATPQVNDPVRTSFQSLTWSGKGDQDWVMASPGPMQKQKEASNAATSASKKNQEQQQHEDNTFGTFRRHFLALRAQPFVFNTASGIDFWAREPSTKMGKESRGMDLLGWRF